MGELNAPGTSLDKNFGGQECLITCGTTSGPAIYANVTKISATNHTVYYNHLTLHHGTGAYFHRHDSILVVVDRLTKMSHLVHCSETITASQLADLFVHHIFRLHGLPEEIISDRGPQFRSQFWKSTLKLLGIKQSLSTTAHPQTDGQTEQTNQTLEQYLRCYVDYQQSNSSQYLALAEFALNNSTNSSTGMSPFYALYGWHLKADFLDRPPVSPTLVPASNEFMLHLSETHALLRDQFEKAHRAYKAAADQHRSSHQFHKGDQVSPSPHTHHASVWETAPSSFRPLYYFGSDKSCGVSTKVTTYDVHSHCVPFIAT